MFGANTCIDCPYTIFGVSPNASDAEIRKGYRSQSLLYHPDRLANRPAADQVAGAKRMQLINGAHELLSDTVAR
jgi:DnaJ family protein A protein 2